MMYARHKCQIVESGEDVVITGPYFDDRNRTRTVTVKRSDLQKYNEGTFIQDAFPYLSADDREFLISGMSPEGWDKFSD